MLLGPYCHRCGQREQSPVVPFRRLAGEWAEDVFDVDGRLARTLALLFRRPGALTLAWIRGQRTRYLPPLRLYLLASVVYFGVLAFSGTQRFLGVFALTGEDAAGSFAAFLDVVPTVMVLLLPFFALLLKVLHSRVERVYIAHVVFALHYHVVLFLIFPLEALLDPVARREDVLGGVVAAGLVAVPVYVFVYLVLAFRRVYGEGWLGAGLRAFGLWLIYALALGFGGMMAVEPLRAMLFRAVAG